MKILAIDQATVSGWCMAEASGVWKLKKASESPGMRVLRFKQKLIEAIELGGIDVVVYERPAGRHAASLIVSGQLVGMILLVCEERGLNYRCYSAGEIKKYATGKGNCGKPAMVAAAIKRFPEIEIIDDNHADALFLYHLAMEDI